MFRPLRHVPFYFTAFWIVSVSSLPAEMQIVASADPLIPAEGHPALLARYLIHDQGGNTSLRWNEERVVDENKYPLEGVTVFAKEARQQPQRDRDLGQTFLTGKRSGKVDSLYLRIGHGSLAVRPRAPGARIAVQWFRVSGIPLLNDHGTPGNLGRFDRTLAPELDDYLTGEIYTPLAVIEGRLPHQLAKGDYLRFTFPADEAPTLEAESGYAFLLMFLEKETERGMTLANKYYGSYQPDKKSTLAGHGIRREGHPAFPDNWKARLELPPTTLGFPDVCTFRDLYFGITLRE